MSESKFEEQLYKQFDQVRLLTTKNVRYMSAPAGTKVSPQGVWSVAASVGGELLLVKQNVTIRIPTADVLKVVDYDIQEIVRPLGRLTDGKGQRKEGA